MSSALHQRLLPPSGFPYEDAMSPTSSSSSSSCNFFFDQPRLGPCDLTDPVWTKMSSVAAGVKKRKKPEAKPQSQINKCLNEKRRREQENIHIEELAELISASFTEMSSLSVKPDKCAILQETVNQIRTIKQQEVTGGSDAVQQGEVSSSKPTIIAQELIGPLLLEALEGFLFVVSKEGNVEFVTENVTNFLNYSKDEVLGKSIYNFIHHGDHTRFSHVLLPVSSVGWPPVDPTQKNRTFTCRLLVKPPDDQETMEEKQQRISKYENMQISSTQLPYPGDKSGEGGSGGDDCGDIGLMCVARRIPQNEKHLQLGAPIEQFTIKLEPTGKIIAVDTSGLSNTYSQFINKDLTNWSIQELLHPADKGKAQNYLRDMLNGTGGADLVSPIYRLRVSHSQDKYVHVQTKARFFKCSSNSESDFIMATHSIISDNDVAAAEANSPHAVCGQTSSGGSVGGPLMASVNGTTHANDSGQMNLNTNTFVSFPSGNDLNYDFIEFPSSTLNDFGMMTSEERIWDRPESRHSTPTPSPHPSTVPTQPSPYQTSITFPFSPLPEQTHTLEETKERTDQSVESGSSESDSKRLRKLLTTNRSSIDSDDGGGGGGSQKNEVLKNLLEDGEGNKNQTSNPPTPKPSIGNNMLLKLLNDRNHDDDSEARAGIKKHNEILTQLLKDEENKSHHHNDQDDPLLKSLGFSHSPEGPAGRARKRPSEDGDEPPAKRQQGGPFSTLETLPPVSSSAPGNSKLWEKNKMLASLLSKQPSTPTPAQIPPIPASVISATPQEKLPRIVKQPGWSGGIVSSGTITRTTQQDPCRRGQRVVPQPGYPDHPQIWTDEIILSDILDQFIDDELEPDAISTDPGPIITDMINQMPMPQQNQSQSDADFPPTAEKLAIIAIQQSLMQCETMQCDPAAKSAAHVPNTIGSNQQNFPVPPPMYTTRPRFTIQPGQGTIRPGTGQYITNQQQQILLQQRTKILQAQAMQQKQRLLQQQSQQQMLIPNNATAGSVDGLTNIDSIINGSVAPNVSLQRSSSVPDSQLSPGGFANIGTGAGNGGGTLLNSGSQISPSQRQPYSPLGHQQPFSPVNGVMNNFQQQQQSQQQQQQQQQVVNAQARLSPSSLPSFQQAQLSPRVSQAQQQYTVMSQTNSWPQQQQARLTLQQQQNPMLNAQLTGGAYSNNRNFVNQQQQQQQQRPSQPQQQLPPVRSLTSPSAVARQSPFSPEMCATGQVQGGTQYRIQRTISAPPQATTQLPGSVRHYAATGMKEHHPLLSPSYPPHPHVPMYPHPSESPQFCFDQSTLQLYGGSCDRARLPGGGNNGMTEYVRQELRAMVSGRAVQQQVQQVRILPGQTNDMEPQIGLSFDMPSQGGGESPKMNWGNMNADMSAVSPQSAISRTNMDEVSRSGDHKSSLLQKLLSE